MNGFLHSAASARSPNEPHPVRSGLSLLWSCFLRFHSCVLWRNRLLALCLLSTVAADAPLAAGTFDEAMARGISAFERRAEESRKGESAAEPVVQAISAFETALSADPGSLEASVRLMVALWFQGEYASSGDEEKQKIFARGREVGERALDRLAAPAGGRERLDAMTPAEAARALAAEPQAKPLLYWSAVHWGFWGEAFGRFAAARQGVAGKSPAGEPRRSPCSTRPSSGRAPRASSAACTRGLRASRSSPAGSITTSPCVELEIAVALAPEDTFNCLYLAEALAEYRPRERERLRALLEDLAARTPLADRVVEDRRNIETARRLLAGLD